MFKTLRDWLDDRTSYRTLLNPLRRRLLPTGPKWGYSTASCLLWMLLVVVGTGVLMMLSYSPSTTSAWASVHYIEQSPAGSFIRGLHFYGSHALLILFAVHTIRVLAVAAFRAPHELIWVTGLLLLPLVVIWAITGNPLSGTQKGSSQIEVEGNIIASTPLVGPIVQRLLIGGDQVGNLTLTHLYSLHVVILPAIIGLLLVVHIAQVYRHGLSTATLEGGSGVARPYWPYQSVRNMIVFGVVFGIVALLAWQRGAPLDAPADPELSHWTRPEWYFLFLFELRSYFVGQWEFVATVVLPGASLLLLIGMPVLDRMSSARVSAVLRGVIIIAGLAGFAGLTLASVLRDAKDPDHQHLIAESEELASRARELADANGISPAGAISLLRNDPHTQGPLLFQQHCASCHPKLDHSGDGIAAAEPSAPNLHRFGSVAWIEGMLDPERIAGVNYFEQTAFADGEMVNAICDLYDGVEEDAKLELQKQLHLVAIALAAEQQSETFDDSSVAEGVELLTGDLACTDCHRFHDEGDLGSAPDLTGYGSAEWLFAMISNPEHERFYPDTNDRMPAFGATEDDSSGGLMTREQIDLLVRWLIRDGAEPSTDSNPGE
ncbi:MAG: cytochrome bc complex cytochrome b subunit [Planctomycetaceae bacterium]|nr:cytochrome bc complex cytochrome b subunit [Planctomycetales bacterium]MCB9873090.1 cytochrome bc complex cytochrome b subunit [Planctomycetaceae bacterium]MCB9937770.1 cytochrome bc complex cytochrome b subunit [Planctomycetaceae bacterium]